MRLTRAHWLENKIKNQAVILGNTMQIMMAREIIKLCDREIAKFPKPKPPKKKALITSPSK